ncbi:hypothetical protein [Comamonas thiooxydans]|uniref:hypothetical protein n=1 Tax=Comamonas thiooxydans TaxID=363952 RepID=UPI001CCC79F0|nr:hypothetical protein [Comamonas thiooxydans]UBQ41347.1 hypothetical protein LCH15_21940 [Comamonas thiooxydans]
MSEAMGGDFAKNATPTSASAEVRHCGSKMSEAMGGDFAKNATLTSASAEVRHCGSKTSAAMGGGATQSTSRISACVESGPASPACTSADLRIAPCRAIFL